MSARRPAGWRAPALALAAALAAAAPSLLAGARADSTDAVQLGVGMGAMGALVGSAAGPTGALVGGVVGFGLGAAMGGARGPKAPRDPATEQRLQAERAAWSADRARSEEHLRDQQRRAFEERLMAGQAAAPSDSPARSVLVRSHAGAHAGEGLVASEAPARATSSLVVNIQGELMRLGYAVPVADGVPGPATVAAIEAYELDHQLLITGRPSQELLAHMRRRGG